MTWISGLEPLTFNVSPLMKTLLMTFRLLNDIWSTKFLSYSSGKCSCIPESLLSSCQCVLLYHVPAWKPQPVVVIQSSCLSPFSRLDQLSRGWGWRRTWWSPNTDVLLLCEQKKSLADSMKAIVTCKIIFATLVSQIFSDVVSLWRSAMVRFKHTCYFSPYW